MLRRSARCWSSVLILQSSDLNNSSRETTITHAPLVYLRYSACPPTFLHALPGRAGSRRKLTLWAHAPRSQSAVGNPRPQQVSGNTTESDIFVVRSRVQWVIVYQALTMDAQALKEGRCSLVAEALRTWGGLKIRATGVSMLPTLWPGDLLTVQSRRLEEIEPGEIVLYRRRDRFFIHRAVRKCLIGDGLFLIARGDSMPQADPPVRTGQVLGKITEVQRDGSVFLPGRRLSALRRMVGYTFCYWGLFRRVGMRLWGRRHRDDDQIEVAIVEAAP
jgi:signal peptidase I